MNIIIIKKILFYTLNYVFYITKLRRIINNLTPLRQVHRSVNHERTIYFFNICIIFTQSSNTETGIEILYLLEYRFWIFYPHIRYPD